MVSPDHLPTPTQEESNLWLCTGEHLPSGILFRPWQQFSWSEEKTVYPILKNVLFPHRIQPAVCNKLWNVCIADAADPGSMSRSTTVRLWLDGAGESVKWHNLLPSSTWALRSWFQEKPPEPSPLQTRFSSYPWLKGESHMSSSIPSTNSAVQLWAEGPGLQFQWH